MRIVLFLGVLIAVALAGYVGIGGYFLAHAASGLLKVGNISALVATAEPPTDPMALGYRGDPMAALSLPFQTVTLDTPLGPTEAWLVPAAGAEAGRAIYVHGIAGAREDGYRALSILHAARGEWHYGSVYLGGAYFGCKNRFGPCGQQTEALALPEELKARLTASWRSLKEIG